MKAALANTPTPSVLRLIRGVVQSGVPASWTRYGVAEIERVA